MISGLGMFRQAPGTRDGNSEDFAGSSTTKVNPRDYMKWMVQIRPKMQ